MIPEKLAKALERKAYVTVSRCRTKVTVSPPFDMVCECSGMMLSRLLSVPLEDIPKYMVGDAYREPDGMFDDLVPDRKSLTYKRWFELLGRTILLARLEVEV